MKYSNKQSYTKPFLNIEAQITKLKSRGMTFEDEEKAKRYLENINYYRLSGYWLIFEKVHDTHQFKDNTTFEKVIDIYTFDRELRLLFLEAIERIEVSIRTKFAYILSQKYGSHFHLNPELFYCPIKYSNTILKLSNDVKRSKEICVVHFKNNYKEVLPPIWSSIELMTLGQVSNWFVNIKHRKDRQDIAKYYGLDEKVLGSFLHHLTIVRNISAHHSRLWNKRFTLDFILPSNMKEKFNYEKRKYLFNTIVMSNYMLNVIDSDNRWLDKVNSLIDKFDIENEKMGFNISG
ncbi:MAG: Abi family protein [Campylobacterota bacterium]|nr:Abi family protein [Campylobacterota bacterium]